MNYIKVIPTLIDFFGPKNPVFAGNKDGDGLKNRRKVTKKNQLG